MSSQTELLLATFAAGLTLPLLLILWRDYLAAASARALSLLLLIAIVHLFHNQLPSAWHEWAFVAQSAAPACFWAACYYAFSDNQGERRLQWLLALHSWMGPLLFLLLDQPEALLVVLKRIPQGLEYVLILLGVWEVIRHWQSDLLEARRRLRLAVLLATGITVGWSILSFNLDLASTESRQLAIITAFIVITACLLQGRQHLWRSGGSTPATALPDTPETQPTATINNDDDLSKLQLAMADGIYRQEGLTLRSLAQHVCLPEYRLRSAINQQLGFSNFNEYINALRIQEAAQRLQHEPDTPISNIALDVGYRSMSSFNRAFRRCHDTTPTEYRQNRLTQSCNSTFAQSSSAASQSPPALASAGFAQHPPDINH
jgi:AraC-like DNA-binding protein